MTHTLNHHLPFRMRGTWRTLAENYRVAKGTFELAAATDAATDDDDMEAKHDAMCAAIDAILLMPAEHPSDLRLKIEVMNSHDMADGPWWCAQEALSMLSIDADRLLPFSREGEAA